MNSEKKEKILIYSAIGIVICLIIGVIILIWTPFFKNIETSSLNRYDSDKTYESMMKNYYSKLAENYLKINNFDYLYDYISEDYKTNINASSKDEIKNYLISNGLISSNITINQVSYSNIDETSAIYRVFYTSNLGNRYMNITETEPYKFTLSFEQNDVSTLSNNQNIEFNKNMVKYSFKLVEADNSSVRYSLTIDNMSDNQYEFSFSALNSIQLIYNETSYMNMASVANSSSVKYDISPGSSKSIEILFNLPFENQMNVSGFLFRDVNIDGTYHNIKLEI